MFVQVHMRHACAIVWISQWVGVNVGMGSWCGQKCEWARLQGVSKDVRAACVKPSDLIMLQGLLFLYLSVLLVTWMGMVHAQRGVVAFLGSWHQLILGTTPC